MRVVLIDRRDVFRRGLEHILQSRDIEVLGSFSSGVDAAKIQDGSAVQVVVLDIDSPPDQKAGACIRRLKGKFHNAEILVLTHLEDERELIECFYAGAKGYLSKDCSVEHLLTSLSLVSLGGVVVSPEISRGITSIVSDHAATMSDQGALGQTNASVRLTPRETEVLDLINQGASNKAIAERLCITENTVKAHVHNVMSKLKVRSRLQAVVSSSNGGPHCPTENPDLGIEQIDAGEGLAS